MAKLSSVEVPVPEDVANAWRALPSSEREQIGRKLVYLVRGGRSAADEFRELFARIDAQIEASGLTDEIVDAELAAWKAERRDRRQHPRGGGS
jgi:hypothetical protein